MPYLDLISPFSVVFAQLAMEHPHILLLGTFALPVPL